MVLRLVFLMAGCAAAALANPEPPARDLAIKCEVWSSSAAWGSPAAVLEEN